MPVGIVRRVARGHEIMRSIPPKIGSDDGGADNYSNTGVTPTDAPAHAQPAGSDEAGQKIDHRIFRHQPEAEAETESDAPAKRRPALATGERKLPHRDHRQHDEQHHRRIGRDQQAAERHGRQGQIDHRSQRAQPDIVDHTAQHKDRRRRHAMHHGCGQPHLKSALAAAQNGCRANEPADQRRLGIGAERHLAAPEPILRLIDKKVGAVEGQTKDAQGGYEDNR
ncbi:hypothetical protein D3C72_1105880 [compost metagenome]